MQARRVYLAGPINGRSDADCNSWREYITAKLGADRVKNPMARDYRGQEMDIGIAEEIVDGDLRDIGECDAMLVYFDQPSVGTAMEVFYASRRSTIRAVVVVNVSGKPASPWLIYHATAIVETLDEALRFLE